MQEQQLAWAASRLLETPRAARARAIEKQIRRHLERVVFDMVPRGVVVVVTTSSPSQAAPGASLADLCVICADLRGPGLVSDPRPCVARAPRSGAEQRGRSGRACAGVFFRDACPPSDSEKNDLVS